MISDSKVNLYFLFLKFVNQRLKIENHFLKTFSIKTYLTRFISLKSARFKYGKNEELYTLKEQSGDTEQNYKEVSA